MSANWYFEHKIFWRPPPNVPCLSDLRSGMVYWREVSKIIWQVGVGFQDLRLDFGDLP